jgi:hypothetical protein
MEAILNETTQTVHRQETGTPSLRTVCGVTYHVGPDQLRRVSVARATGHLDASKCGRCFDDGGGY